MKLYNAIIVLLALIVGIPTSYANKSLQEFSKTLTKEYDVNADAKVTLSNKYGNIDVESSDRNSVHIKVDIIVEAKNEERANDIMDKITVDFSGSNSSVSATTDFDFNNKWNWGKKNENYKVHYTVQLPHTVRLHVSDKYGDVSITSMQNDVDISVKYGNANLQNIGGELNAYMGYVGSCDIGTVGGDIELESSYSNVSIEGFANGDITSKYSKLSFGSAQDVDLDAKYDNYEFDNVSTLESNGNYNNFDIDQIGSIDIETKYTQIKINELLTSGNFDTGYGNVKIRQLHSDFESIIIDSGYTGYDIGSNGAFNLLFDGKYVSTDFPDLTVNMREKDSNELYIKGHHQNKSGGTINADMKYGHLNIR